MNPLEIRSKASLPTHQTLLALEVSARRANGCNLCRLRWEQLTDSDKAKLGYRTDLQYYFAEIVEGRLELQLEYFMPGDDKEKPSVRKAVVCLNEEGGSV